MPKKQSLTFGLPPGTLVYTGDKQDKAVRINVAVYNEQEYAEFTQTSFRECLTCVQESGRVTWIDINGFHRVEDLETLGECFHLHPLVLEDILNTEQRPKMEDYGTYLFLVFKMLSLRGNSWDIHFEQVCLILGDTFVISLHENHEDIFQPVRARLKAGQGRVRKAGADYLAYALMDLIVDHYFLVMEDMGEAIEDLEAQLVTQPTPASLRQVHRLKRQTVMLRRSVWPLREVISRLERSDSPLIQDATTLYLKDVYDHVFQVMETIETFRDILAGMLDIYLSSVSNRLNEIMKVLTIIATIFIPLTFVVGVYGMNFKNMPELEWHYGYFMVLGVMTMIALGMLLYFRQKKWIGGKAKSFKFPP